MDVDERDFYGNMLNAKRAEETHRIRQAWQGHDISWAPLTSVNFVNAFFQ